MEKTRILYLDDELNNLISFKANFRTFFEIYTTESAEQAKKILKEKDIHIIITDQRMPEVTGVQFLHSIAKEHPYPIKMLLTGYADIETVIEAINKGEIYRYIKKPFDSVELKAIIEEAYNLYLFKKNNRELLEKYKHMFERSSDTIFLVDTKGKLIDFNNAATELLNYSRNQINNIDYKALLEHEQEGEALLKELEDKGTVKNHELILIDNNKNKIDCLVSVNKINGSNGNLIGYHGMIKDITKQKKISHEHIQTILSSEDKQRDGFARDLHDNISQQLAGINFHIQALKNISNSSPEETAKKLGDASDALNKALHGIRDLCYKIMPRTIIGFSLIDSVNDLSHKIEAEEGLNVDIKASKDFPVLDKSLEIILFRAIQEFIANSVKHGKASTVSIELGRSDKKAIISLRDDGIGFDAHNYTELKGTGLKNIKSRIESYNGEMQLQSTNEGTSCKIIVPAETGIAN